VEPRVDVTGFPRRPLALREFHVAPTGGPGEPTGFGDEIDVRPPHSYGTTGVVPTPDLYAHLSYLT
jgi:hypothetical protein